MTKLLIRHLKPSKMVLVRDVVTTEIEQPQSFPVHGQVVNKLGFAGHMVSVTTTLFCHCSIKHA